MMVMIVIVVVVVTMLMMLVVAVTVWMGLIQIYKSNTSPLACPKLAAGNKSVNT